VEHLAIARSGRPVWLSATAVPVLSPTGDFMGFRGTACDITEQKRAAEERSKLEMQLHQAQKLEAIGTLAGGIAHDFNNILTPIIGYTEMALDDVPEDNPSRFDLQQVISAAGRAKDLVKQILTFSRLNQEQLMRPTNVGLVVKEALKLLRASLPSTIEIRKDIQTLMAVADATQIHQVIVNLCTNAAHAMSGRGTLEVSLTEVGLSEQDLSALSLSSLNPGSHLKLTVSDTGQGMSQETMEQIFNPYFTTKQIGEGTGLGLAVVHGIVMRHGGQIEVRSTLGKGSALDVFIPALKTGTEGEAREPDALPRGTERILLVDDERMIADMGTRVLMQLGYRVTARTDPREVLELFRADPQAFDLLITDYTMPHLTGPDLVARLLALRPDLPVILCTGFNEKLTAESLRQAGIAHLVLKPYEKRRMAEIIRNALDPEQG
jgi:signal transduction histidine kinase/ActR/RegA family two-component response regulator